jgi:hypothetical protein
MTRLSTIDQLPDDVRELIGALRRQGRTIDQILAKLRELEVDVSRSALGRHVKEIDEVAEVLRYSRGLGDAIVERFGDNPDARTARLNVELMHAIMNRVIMAQQSEGSVQLEPREAMFLATALEKLGKASLADATAIAKEKEEREKDRKRAVDAAKAAAAEIVDQAGKKFDLSPEALQHIREEIYSLKS